MFRYPTKLPLIVERFRRENKLGDIDKVKWLVPFEMTVLQMSIILKQRMNVQVTQEFFLLIDGKYEITSNLLLFDNLFSLTLNLNFILFSE